MLQKLYRKINEWWMKFRKWGENSIAGNFVVNLIKVVFFNSIFLLLFYGLFIVGPFRDNPSQEPSFEDSGSAVTKDCNVTGINLHGTLMTYSSSDEDTTGDIDMVSSDRIRYFLDQAEKDQNIKAIILEVDSPGGMPVAAQEIADTLKASTKPTVALIRQAGTSGAYYAATGAQKIYASKLSDIGGIGVTQSYVQNVDKNQKEGISFVQLSVGKYKDMGDPNRSLTEEEKALIYRDLNISHQVFIEAVSVNRKIPLADVQKIADGSSVMGAKAKELHLIDEIGGLIEVEKYLSDKIGEKAEVCWY